MGAHSSHHEPLDRNRHGTSSFRRAASLRQSKSKANKLSPNGKMDRLRRSFRDSFRRRGNKNMPETMGPQQWQSDEMDVRTGTCFFYVKYLGCVEVFESRGMQVCEEALRKLNIRKKRPIKAILYISGDGLRVVEDDTKGLIVDQTIEKVSFCAPDRNHDRGFSYICRDGTTRRWLCHGFLSLRDSGERLSHAVGCAFAVCLERKQKRDRECNVTMNFDLSSATFTRQGSFKQPSLTDRLHDGLQDTMNVKTKNNTNKTNQLPAAIMAAANNTTSNNSVSTTTVVNINNISRNSKENIPIRTAPKINTKAIERPHASITLLQRQGSFRGLSHLNHTSPFKRQLSLRISELSSNKERTRSLEYGLDPLNKTFTQFPLLKTPVSPILEMSPTHANEANINTTVTANISTVSDQVNAMCQQLSQGLSLLSQNDNLFTSTTNNQFNSMNMYEYRDLLAHEADEQSSQQIELQPTMLRSTSTISSTLFRTQQQSFIGDNTTEQTQFHLLENSVTVNGDANVANNNNISLSNNYEVSGESAMNNNGVLSESVSGISSIENIPLTPPSTPPLQVGAQLPRPDQWLSSVAQLTLNVSSSKDKTVSTAPVATTSTSSSSTAVAVKTHAPMETQVQPFSVSPAKMGLEPAKMCEKSTSDPFNIDWASISIETPKPPSSNKHTNPFLTNSPCGNLSDQQLKTTCEVQM